MVKNSPPSPLNAPALLNLCLFLLIPWGGVDAAEVVGYAPLGVGTHVQSTGGAWVFDENAPVTLVLYGDDLENISKVFVSKDRGCQSREMLTIEVGNSTSNMLLVTGTLPAYAMAENYICSLNRGAEEDPVMHFTFILNNIGFQIPIYVRIIAAVFLLCLSGLFSGLNLGLMSLDLTSLRILIETGSEQEKKHAQQIEPIRRQGNFLLCTLLLGNVLVNNSLTILLDTLFGGLAAIIGATAGIVVMGEIIPQAICQRFGLVVGAKTLFITKIFMVLTGPLSLPISKLLDCALGEELGVFYRREQLKELIMLTEGHHNMKKDEINMITGVLSINEKTVDEIMTNIDAVFMLNIDTKLDFDTMQEIMQRGFSRIPVFEEDRNNIVGLLFAKDLAFIDSDDELPLESVIKFYNHSAHKVYGDTKVLELMQDLIKERYHMAIVHCIEERPGLDSIYKTVGVVTLEDIIEEIIQQEIVDETDAYVTNDFKKKNDKNQNPCMSAFDKKKDTVLSKITPQLQLATFTFLNTQIPEFKEDKISTGVLNKLLKKDVVRELKPGDKALVEAGESIDFMVMILTGEVMVEVGKEKMMVNRGPFSTFCIPALRGPFVPDITITPGESGTTQYLYITREEYKRALEATAMKLEEMRNSSDRGSHSSRPNTPKRFRTITPRDRELAETLEAAVAAQETDGLLASSPGDIV